MNLKKQLEEKQPLQRITRSSIIPELSVNRGKQLSTLHVDSFLTC